MKKNIFNMIIFISFIKITIDGLNGEFYNPSLYDLLKWICFIVLLITYISITIKERKDGKI